MSRLRTASENQILINIHELFHLFQNAPFYFGFKDAAVFPFRFFPGWQKDFLKEGRFLDKTIAEKLGVSPEATEARAKGLAARYPVEDITLRHKPVIEGRDAAPITSSGWTRRATRRSRDTR